MSRMFDTHYIRDTVSLDGSWDFEMDGFKKKYKLNVPACWEQHPDFTSHRGTGVYTKKIYIKKNSNIRLEFKGVSHTADVYFDGEKAAHHYNAFTPFSCILKNIKKGEHELCVKVDNSFSEKSALHVPNDYYTYGGITRPVNLEYIPDVYIKHLHFTPFFDSGVWKGKISVCVVNLSSEEKSINLKSELLGVINKANIGIAAESERVYTFENDYPDALSWDTKNPILYYLTASIECGTAADDLIERVGFRTVFADEKNFILNGKPIFFKGVNRHEDYANFGCAVPVSLMAHDLDLIRDLGANAVRTSHYPNDERFLDMCDERGILVWEENHARGFGLEQMSNPNFEKQCEDCIEEMIQNHYNHPSIVIWGILNECASETPEGRTMYKKQFEQVKSLDNSRPTSFATCRHFTDISLDLPDIVSFNYYTGWYSDGDVTEEMDRVLDWIKKSGGENKPVIISEFGAGGIYGYRDRTKAKWSEERQAEIIADNLKVYLNNEKLAGIFIWQFCDCRVTEEKWFGARPKSQNNKGLVDIYRRPKLAYDTVKNILSDN